MLVSLDQPVEPTKGREVAIDFLYAIISDEDKTKSRDREED